MNEKKKCENDKINLFTFIKGKGILPWLMILLTVGVIFLILGNSGVKSNVSSTENEAERIEKYTSSLEAKIAELCSKVSGVSNVSVSVYLDSGFESVYAYNEENKISSSGTNSEKKYVTLGSGNDESMVCVLEKAPHICGIAIVCNGGGNSGIAEELIGLISSAYGVSKNKIYIAEAKK